MSDPEQTDEGLSTVRLQFEDGMLVNPDEHPRPTLTILTGPSFGELYTIADDEVVIGRSTQADFRLDDASISRRHARIYAAGEEFEIEDLGSANGTWLNGEPLKGKVRIEDGDKITLGPLTILRFGYTDAFDEAFQRRIYDAALRDGLTRAYNKRYVRDRLGVELAFARRHDSPLCLVIFDIDHFKKCNDTHGHLAGDAILADLVRELQKLIREEDIFGRYGGEEFVVVCRDTTLKEGTILAERLREATENHSFEFQGTVIPITISVGVAGVPDLDAARPEALVAAADSALYNAKRTGRNRVSVFDVSK